MRPTASEAERFASLCELIAGPAPAEAWVLLGYRIEFVDVHQILITRSTALDSPRLVQAHPMAFGQRQLTPVVVLDADMPQPEAIRVVSIRGSRVSTPAPSHSVSAWLAGRRVPQRIIAVSLDRDEYLTSPVLEIETTASDEPPLGRLNARSVLPVSKIEVTLSEPLPLTELTLKFPRYASVDIVGVSCAVIWQDFADEVVETLQLEVFDESDEERLGIVERNIVAFARLTRDRIDHLIKEVVETAEEICGIRKRPWSKPNWVPEAVGKRSPPEAWVTDLRTAKDQISKYIDTAQAAPLDPNARARDLLALFKSLGTTKFTFGTTVQEDGAVDLDRLGNAVMHRKATLAMNAIVLPFTTEGEPATQGKRSATILLLLAALLLAIARVDLSWLHGWMRGVVVALPGNAQDPLVTGEDARALIEPLVAMLLIFPAALYAQFFQTRPRTDIGNRAQLTTFATLSIVFAFPLLPAAVAATGGSFQSVSKLCVVGGILAMASGAAVAAVFIPSSLKRIRRGIVKRWRPAERTPAPETGGALLANPRAA